MQTIEKIFLSLLRKYASSKYGKMQSQSFFENLHRQALAGMNYGKGSNIDESGEGEVLNLLTRKLTPNPVLFDVGANKGEYSMLLGKIFPSGKIYSFEPDALNYSSLKENVSMQNLKAFNIAFGSEIHEAELYSNKSYPGISGLYKRDLSHIGIGMESSGKIYVDTIDIFSATNNIEKIDFLKLDTEGSELDILIGASNMLANDAISAIQFEFGGCNIDSKTYFKDFYRLLTPRFNLYRILQDGIFPMAAYSEYEEIFVTSNFLALHKDLDYTA